MTRAFSTQMRHVMRKRGQRVNNYAIEQCAKAGYQTLVQQLDFFLDFFAGVIVSDRLLLCLEPLDAATCDTMAMTGSGQRMDGEIVVIFTSTFR